MKNSSLILPLLVTLFCSTLLLSQGEVELRSDGIAVPALTTIERDAIASPANGQIIFNETTVRIEVYDTLHAGWKPVGNTTPPPAGTPYEIKDLVDQNTVVGAYDSKSGDYILMAIEGTAGIRIDKTPLNDMSLQFQNAFNTHNTFIGDQAGLKSVGNDNTLLGAKTGGEMTIAIYNTALGSEALANSVSNGDNTAVGYRALSLTGNGKDSSSVGNNNTAVGSNAGLGNLYGSRNTFIGNEAAKNGQQNSRSIFIGHQAGKDADDEDNIGIGYQSLSAVGKEIDSGSQGKKNVAIGNNAGATSTSAYNNVFLGYDSGKGVETGYDNVYVGYNSGEFNTAGHHNTTLGFQSGGSIMLSSGDYNVNLGSEAGYNTNGDFNTRVGRSSGRNSDGDLNVFLGHEAGFNEDGSNKLIISNDKDKQLIYGEFDNNLVQINGDLNTNEGDIKMKNLGVADFDKGIKWSETNNAVFGMTYDGEGTDTENRLHIQEYIPGGPGKIMTIKANGNVGIGVTNPIVEMDIDGTLWLRQQTLSNAACNSTTEYGKLAFDSATKKLAVCANIAPSPAPENPGWFFLH